jgi:hypothetical protein
MTRGGPGAGLGHTVHAEANHTQGRVILHVSHSVLTWNLYAGVPGLQGTNTFSVAASRGTVVSARHTHGRGGDLLSSAVTHARHRLRSSRGSSPVSPSSSLSGNACFLGISLEGVLPRPRSVALIVWVAASGGVPGR